MLGCGRRPWHPAEKLRPKRELGVSSDLVDIFLLSLVAMFNPTLLAAVTIMMLMPNPSG